MLPFVFLCIVSLPPLLSAPQATPGGTVLEARPVRLTTRDGGIVRADLYGAGTHGLVLAHGGQFTKASWNRQLPDFLQAGFQILAIDFRGFGESQGEGQERVPDPPHHLDVLAAVSYLRTRGAKTVAVIGGSFGGVAAASAAVEEPRSIDRLVLLGATPDPPAEKLTIPKLYIMTRDDANAAGPRLPGLEAHVAKAREPKTLIVLPGSAHAQFMFDTDLAPRIMREIMGFLTAP